MSRLIVGAPVANRAWALPYWFECLMRQTRRPDGIVFVHSGQVEDETRAAIRDLSEQYQVDTLVHHDGRAPHPRHDNDRFVTLTDLRNRVMRLVTEHMRPDVFLSLDTDVMLENPQTVEHLAGMLAAGCDVASCATFLHPGASDPEVDHGIFWSYNAGWWTDPSQGWNPRKGWQRPHPREIQWDRTYRIDIPMAVWAGSSRVFECEYRWHESGEDIGFGQSLLEHGLTCLWDPRVRAKHVWQPSHLQVAA